MEHDPGLCLDVPEGFDDSDADSQVHPMARKLFSASTAAGAFGKAQEWVGEQSLLVVDVSWDYAWGEDEPYTLSVYFTFELDPDDA
ncbi:hypothetical protein FCH28_05970 [Streptomyces piniterrae]|uniref:Uncharacterized protein n=1 Tax=Streptomyces piniterrae TaxID=2571125 RepID=A0A4U0NRH2_9ACTN|nr:hypothetical protein [Streptomyces piniterrae]TJZ57020.1 hypothetical protein FCH28_05970 [Streptomyces piniterrae]